MKSSYEVSCIVVCYHRPESLQIMADGLADSRVELIVVNAEVDPQIEAIAHAAGAVHVPLEGDPGPGTALNLGVKHATCDVVVLLNDDLRVTVEIVLRLRQALLEGEGDVVLPAVYDADGELEASIKAAPTPVALIREVLLLPDRPIPAFQRRVHVEKWRRPTQPERVDSCGAPVIACRAALLLAYPMPEDYFLYWDEVDWFWRLRAAGKVLIYDPDIHVQHIGGRRDISPMKSRLITRNAVRCVLRTQGRTAAFSTFWIMLLYNLRLVLIATVRVVMGRDAARQELRARLAGLSATPASFREVLAPIPD